MTEAPGGAGKEPARAARKPEKGRRRGDVHRCDLCGAEMLNRHCKLLCLRCGYQRDCSDP